VYLIHAGVNIVRVFTIKNVVFQTSRSSGITQHRVRDWTPGCMLPKAASRPDRRIGHSRVESASIRRLVTLIGRE
jgi:hypothetical protein